MSVNVLDGILCEVDECMLDDACVDGVCVRGFEDLICTWCEFIVDCVEG